MKKARRIKNILHCPRLLFAVIKNINRQKKFIEKNISPLLDDALKMADACIDINDQKKITGYYGLAVPAVLGEAFCALRGKSMTGKERHASTCQGGLTGLGDDFFDKQRLSDEAVKELVENPQQFTVNSASEKLFLHFYTTVLVNAPNPVLMQAHLLRVYYAQLLSKKQARPGLSYEEIKDITLRKGAESLIFYRTVFIEPVTDAEQRMLWCFGGLMQLSNDIFDVYPDQQNGINTLLTTAKNISDIRQFFISLMQMGYTAAYATKYPRHNVKKFIDIISISIFSRCLVCLDQLERNEKRSGGIFTPGKYKRKDLICDMDTALNKWRSLKYHIKYAW
jgi:hypothetical protein